MKSTRSCLLPIALAACATGCLETSNRPIPRGQAVIASEDALSDERPALDEERIEDFGFTVYWDSFVPGEQITNLFVEGQARRGSSPQLYAFTRSKRLYQIDMQSGKVNWIYDVNRRLDFIESGQPLTEWVYRPDTEGQKPLDELFFIAQDRLFALDKTNGSELWQHDLPFSASSAPAVSPSHVYVGSWADRIYAIEKDNRGQPDWFVNTGDDVRARPLATRGSVFAPSMDGSLYVIGAERGELRGDVETGGPLKVDPLSYQRHIYLPGSDYHLYVLRNDDGTEVDRYNAGAPISDIPVGVTDRALDGTVLVSIFVTASDTGLHALRRLPSPKETRRPHVPHELLWVRKEADKFLCRGRSDVYLREPNREVPGLYKVARVDAEKGVLRDLLDLGRVDFWITNSASPQGESRDEELLGGMMILGFQNGWIIALKETVTLPSGAAAMSLGRN